MAAKKLTAELVEAKLREFHGNFAAVARVFGVTRSAVYQFVNSRTTLQAVAKECRESMKDNAESALYSAVLSGEAWAVCFYLKTQAKDRGYVERQEIQNVGDDELDAEIERELAKMGADRQAPSAPQDSLSESVEPSARPASDSLP